MFEISLIFFVCIFILYNHFLSTNSENLIFDLSIFIAASIRILPSLNQLTGNLNHLRYSKKYLDDIYDEFIKEVNFENKTDTKIIKYKKNIDFDNLRIENVYFLMTKKIIF